MDGARNFLNLDVGCDIRELYASSSTPFPVAPEVRHDIFYTFCNLALLWKIKDYTCFSSKKVGLVWPLLHILSSREKSFSTVAFRREDITFSI